MKAVEYSWVWPNKMGAPVWTSCLPSGTMKMLREDFRRDPPQAIQIRYDNGQLCTFRRRKPND